MQLTRVLVQALPCGQRRRNVALQTTSEVLTRQSVDKVPDDSDAASKSTEVGSVDNCSDDSNVVPLPSGCAPSISDFNWAPTHPTSPQPVERRDRALPVPVGLQWRAPPGLEAPRHSFRKTPTTTLPQQPAGCSSPHNSQRPAKSSGVRAAKSSGVRGANRRAGQSSNPQVTHSFPPSFANQDCTMGSVYPQCATPAGWHDAGACSDLLSLLQPSDSQIPTCAQDLRKSISALKGALKEWEANLQDPSALQRGVSRMPPQDAAMVKALLDPNGALARKSEPVYEPWQPFAPGLQQAYNNSQNFGGSGHVPTKCRPARGVNQKSFDEDACIRRARNGVAAAQTCAEVESSSSEVETLRTFLRDLTLMGPGRALMVRKINRLGFESAALLQDHFSKFGTVERTMVSHTRARTRGRPKARERPATVGFVVMGSVEEAEAALSHGVDHIVEGEHVFVFRFESGSISFPESPAIVAME